MEDHDLIIIEDGVEKEGFWQIRKGTPGGILYLWIANTTEDHLGGILYTCDDNFVFLNTGAEWLIYNSYIRKK